MEELIISHVFATFEGLSTSLEGVEFRTGRLDFRKGAACEVGTERFTDKLGAGTVLRSSSFVNFPGHCGRDRET